MNLNLIQCIVGSHVEKKQHMGPFKITTVYCGLLSVQISPLIYIIPLVCFRFYVR